MGNYREVMKFARSLSVVLLFVAAAGCNRSPEYYIGRGKALYASGKYEDATLEFRKALQKDPNSAVAFYELGLTASAQHKFPDAYMLLSRAVELAPSGMEAKVGLANTALMLFIADPTRPPVLYSRIAKLSDDLLRQDAKSFDGLRLKASLAFLDHRLTEAIDTFQKANQIKPMQHDLILAWTQALIQDKQMQTAERLASELISKDPGFGPIYDTLYEQYLTQNREPDAENILRTKVRNNPANADYVVQLAEHYARAKKATELSASLQPLLANSRQFPDGLLKAGDFYVRIGDVAEGIRTFEKGAANDRSRKLVYQKRIVNAVLAQGKRDEALRLVAAILKDSPKDMDARRVRAALTMESGRPEDVNASINEFRQLEGQLPNDAVLHFDFGRAFLAKGDLSQATSQFKTAVRLRNDYIPALYNLAEISMIQNRPSESLDYIRQLLSYQPNDTRGKLLGISVLIALKRYSDARSELGYLAEALPGNPDVQLQYGLLAVAEGKYQEAERVLQKIYEAGQKDPRPALALAQSYSAQQQFERAIQLLQEDSRRSPESVDLKGMLAYLAGRVGQHDLAIRVYQELVAQEPGSVELYSRLALVHHAKGDYAGAIPVLQEAGRLAPKSVQPLLLLAISLDKAGRTEEARNTYKQVLQLQPENPTALNNLAFLLVETGGDVEEAVRLASRALQKSPGQLNYADTLGWAYVQKRQPAAAIQIFNNLVKASPENATFQYHLGAALAEQGDKARARVALTTALANRPTKDQEAKIKALLASLG
ncbi:MAG: hypothetical protein C5B51_15125 [Terriglobia bacterium]|nr:MAG: hypothetical protein C5B51_15125 [Terriglobia bacterium]